MRWTQKTQKPDPGRAGGSGIRMKCPDKDPTFLPMTSEMRVSTLHYGTNVINITTREDSRDRETKNKYVEMFTG